VATALPAQHCLEADPSSVRAARRMVSELATGAFTQRLLDCLLLATSEVVTNAIEHGAPPIELRVERLRHHLRVEVRDTSPLGPRIRPDDVAPTELRGRGMRIVEGCTDRWGIEPMAEGKAVWFEIDLRD